MRKAIGTVTGTDSSISIERLLGIFNRQKGVSRIKCPPGDPCILVKFYPNNQVEEVPVSETAEDMVVTGSSSSERTQGADTTSMSDSALIFEIFPKGLTPPLVCLPTSD